MVLAVLALSAVVALFRGLVQEVLGIGAWVGAALAALALQPVLSPYLLPSVETPWIADAIALAGVFLVVLVALKIAISMIARRVQDSALGGADRALGMVFGLARGAFLVVVAYILGGVVLSEPERWPDPVREARSLPAVAFVFADVVPLQAARARCAAERIARRRTCLAGDTLCDVL